MNILNGGHIRYCLSVLSYLFEDDINEVMFLAMKNSLKGWG